MDTGEPENIWRDGFLENWDGVFGIRSPDGPKYLNEILGVRCLILCGEPGMGKSTALESYRPYLEANAKETGEIYWAAFRNAIGVGQLLTDLKNSNEWKNWLGGKDLTLIIDGIDEGLALAPNLINALNAELRNKPVERLRLILACRDAEWPVTDGRALMALWPNTEVGRYQLQRLSATDARQAARQWGLSESEDEAFMEAVQEKAVEAFAARPITLRMLVDEFKEHRQLPGTRTEIFRRGCLRLCREDPQRAKNVKQAIGVEFTAEQLLPAAKRIATLMLLGRYSAVSKSPPELRPAQHLDFEILVPVDTDQREREKVEAALGSGLFCDAGKQGRAFAHQSYAEFLAAEHLVDFPLAQLLQLLCIQEGSHQFVVPQLAELAAWLALRHPEFQEWLIGHEPEILLRNDASSLSESQRAKLVEKLLERMAREEVFDDWDLKRFYGSFRHSGLVAQLRPYLTDKKATWVVRRAAIHLADLGELIELFDELLAVARDSAEDIHLREQAMNAVGRLVSQDRLAELEPFARCEVGDDQHDELRAAALKALIPLHWKVSTALASVRLPHNNKFTGAFDMVCANHIPRSIETSDLPALLTALGDVDHPFEGYQSNVRPLACRALVLAIQNLTLSKVAEAFVALVRDKLRTQQLPHRVDDNGWDETVQSNPTIRQQLASHFVTCDGMTADELGRFCSHGLIPLAIDDCPWVLQQLQLADASRRPLWAKLLARSFWPKVAETMHRDLFFETCEHVPELAAEIRWPRVLRLDSQEAKEIREMADWQKRNEEQAKNRPAKPTADQHFDSALRAARDDWQQWYRLAWELQRAEDGSEISGVNLDPTNKHRWKVCKPDQREHILRCAREFLLHASPGGQGTKTDQEVPLATFWALWLLKGQLITDEALRTVVVAKWFDSLCAQPFHGASEEQELTRLAVTLDSNRAADCLRRRLEWTASSELSVANVLVGFELAWKPEFTPVLLNFLRERTVTGVPLRSALAFLARHDEPSVESWLAKECQAGAPADAPVVLALTLALFPKEFWVNTKSRLKADKDLATACLQNLADLHASSVHKPLDKLTEEQLGDLFLILETAFPSQGSVKLKKDEVSEREQIEGLRRWVSERLKAMASPQACRELTRLADALPHWSTSMRWQLRDTRLALLRKSWPGVSVGILTAMAANRDSRWVRNADDLLALVMDSLRRFQDRLNRSEQPIVRHLWNEPTELGPKAESALTQELVQWLKDDLGPKNGIALGCQVEPSPIHELDIEVSAAPGGAKPTGERFVVTIEIKRNDNPEVGTSLEKQLVAEYLIKLGRSHGIYVVGWLKATNWSPAHNPLKAKTWIEANEKVNELVVESRKIHPELRLEAICLNCEFPQAFRKRP